MERKPADIKSHIGDKYRAKTGIPAYSERREFLERRAASARPRSSSPSASQATAAITSRMREIVSRWPSVRPIETIPVPITTAPEAGGIAPRTRSSPTAGATRPRADEPQLGFSERA